MSHSIGSLKKELFFCSSWILFAVVFVLFAFYCPWLPEGEKFDVWFQRSGSVLVVITVWVQFKLSNLATFFDEDAYSVPFYVPKNVACCYSWLSTGNVLLMIIGTAIWGYGDIFI